MTATVGYVVLAAVVFVAVGMGVLALWNLRLGLQLKTTHSGFLQAWIYILQTVVLAATLLYLGVQAAQVERSVRTNTVQLMVSAHRDLLREIVERPSLLAAITADELPADSSSRVYMSMFFNHGFNAFALRQECYIDDEWWSAIIRDMRNLVRYGAMKKWWSRVRAFYPLRYQEFVERQILGDAQEERRCGNW